MSINTLEYSQIFQDALDEEMISGSTTGWMELNSDMVKYNGGNEIKLPSIIMDGLADYDRDNGFTAGGVKLTWETKAMSMDRGRSFQLDENDVDETNFVVTAGNVMGQFQRTKVIPEVDAYRYSKVAQTAITANKNRSIAVTKSNILSELKDDIAYILDIVGEGEQIIVTLSHKIGTILDLADEIKKSLSVVEFTKGEVTTKTKALDDAIILRAPSGRMKTEYVFNDGKTAGQEKGGFVTAETAKSINWLITVRRAVIAVSKTDKVRIFDPETNQKARAWGLDYRKYHDLWIPKNKLDGIFVNTAPAQ